MLTAATSSAKRAAAIYIQQQAQSRRDQVYFAANFPISARTSKTLRDLHAMIGMMGAP